MESFEVNLKELIRVAFTEPVSWIVPADEKEVMVRWVILQLQDNQGGDLLLLAAEQVSEQAVRDAVENGIPAVLAVGEKPPEPGENVDIPILFVETELAVQKVQRRLIQALTNFQTMLAERELSIHQQLTQLAADGVGIEGLARAMHEISSRGVLVQDKRLAVIAGFPSPELQQVWGPMIDELSERDSLPPALRDRITEGMQNVSITQEMSGSLTRVIVPIVAGNVARGYLSVIGPGDGLDTLDEIVAREGALICAVDMFRAKSVRETEKRLQGDLLTALLQNDLSSYDAGLWIEEMGLDQLQSHAAMQFAWATPMPPSRRRLETLINGEVVRSGARVILNPAGDKVICFCQVPPKAARPELALALGEKVIEQGRQEYPEHRICCGVGVSVPELNQWQGSLREASQALQLALRLAEGRPLYYPDLSIYRLLMLLENNPELKAFHDDLLGPLFPYENKNAFIETLEAYFANNGNLAQTAKALFIHRNTLSYRLSRIQEITQMDLNNADTALALQLAIRIHKVFEG